MSMLHGRVYLMLLVDLISWAGVTTASGSSKLNKELLSVMECDLGRNFLKCVGLIDVVHAWLLL